MAETGAGATSRDRTSPYGTAKGLSDSPLVHDPHTVRALHLIPPTPDQRVGKEYYEWKKQEQIDKAT